MADSLENPLLTGYDLLDQREAPVKRAPRNTLTGFSLLKDPTEHPRFQRLKLFDDGHRDSFKFEDIDKAYNVDSFVRQGVDKYIELCTKHGWHLDCETPEPAEYLNRRLRLMGHLAGTEFQILLDSLVLDFIKYGNAFWIKKRQVVEHPLMPPQGVAGKLQPVAGYFRADPKRMKPYWSKDGRKLLGWEFTVPDGKPIRFPRQDVIHFPHNVQAGDVWGSPFLVPVLEDVRAYRQCEEYVIKLLYKHLNPLMHHEVPDNTGGYGGRQEDVDAAFAAHQVIAPDGMIITPPGHKISMVGAESRALRGEGYMEILKARVYAGLGVSQLVMGEGETTTTGSADVMTATMHNRAKFLQRQLAELLTAHVLTELLLEGGFDPLNPLDHTSWVWQDIETEAKIARENHTIQKWSTNLTTHEEARRELGLKPLSEEEMKGLFIHVVQIPELEAAADAKAAAAPATGAAKASAAKARPSNQHGTRPGPKIRPR